LERGALETVARFFFSRRHAAITDARYGLAISTDYSMVLIKRSGSVVVAGRPPWQPTAPRLP
jgi:hypothetical protein